MHRKHMFSEIWNENGFSTENIENFTINYAAFTPHSQQTTHTQLQTTWPLTTFKILGNDVK